MIFFSDFEKAFDSINHDYLFKSLKHFNFNEDFIKWIKLFYSNERSCVTNNGFLSPFFSVQRGVRQGCPLSPYLFILCIELLTNQIRNNENTSGINICGFGLKNACYADDASFILDGSKKSFETLVTILENFSNISGLQLNTKKCQILRIGSSKYTDVAYMKNKQFQWSSIEARALGMIFTNNKTDIMKINLEKKISQFETCLKQWQHRKLTLMGKVTVVKKNCTPKTNFCTFISAKPTKVHNRSNRKDYVFLYMG